PIWRGMALPRRLLVLACALSLGALLAAPSFAAPPPGHGGVRGAGSCDGFPSTLGSTHFLVHYYSNVGDTSCDVKKAISETQAGDVLGWAEKAYTEEVTNLGFPAPPSDGALGGDSRYDLYITNEDAATTGILSISSFDGGPPSSSGSINLDAQLGLTPHVIAHAFFNLVQFGMWLPASPTEYWLLEETAEWMAARVNGYAQEFVNDLGPTDMALDCRDPIGTNKCDLKDGYANLAFSRWPFWQSVTQLYGPSFVKEVFLHGAANPGENGVAALSGALAAHGANLTDTFTNWTVQQMSGGYGLDVLDQVRPKVWQKVSTGIISATLPPIDVPVNHLATRLVEFDRGDGSGGGTCFAAKLTLTVTLPDNLVSSSKPTFYWNGLNSSPVQLAISGKTASATLPWDTCTWVGNQGYLNLPNPDTDPTHNGELVHVVATIDVDTKTPGQAASPPDPVKVPGTVVQAPATVAPTVAAFGPELIRVNPGAPIVRLILRSSGEGKVRATLGATVLGTTDLRPGMNDVRYPLPKSLLPKLRR